VDDARLNSPETIVIPATGPTWDAPLAPQVPSIAGKPWFVVATKADLDGTQENFRELKEYLERVGRGEEEHPSGQEKVWEGRVEAVPVSAINGHGTERITEWVVNLLED
jgi:GTP-binding protein